jgi:hypothetical protein
LEPPPPDFTLPNQSTRRFGGFFISLSSQGSEKKTSQGFADFRTGNATSVKLDPSEFAPNEDRLVEIH